MCDLDVIHCIDGFICDRSETLINYQMIALKSYMIIPRITKNCLDNYACVGMASYIESMGTCVHEGEI